MPLVKSGSKGAFTQNLKTEMNAGKPMKQSLAIAYAMKRHNAKKMAHGGEVGNEKLHPMHEPEERMEPMDRSGSIVHSIMNGKRMAEGGMAEGPYKEEEHNDEADDMSAMSHSADTFLTDEHDSGPEYDGMLKEGDEEGSGEEDEKKMMSRIMNEVRMRHMGR